MEEMCECAEPPSDSDLTVQSPLEVVAAQWLSRV